MFWIGFHADAAPSQVMLQGVGVARELPVEGAKIQEVTVFFGLQTFRPRRPGRYASGISYMKNPYF